MVIYYKKETNIVKYVKSKVKTTLYKKGGFLSMFGLGKVQYPDIYFHSGALHKDSLELIKNSKKTIVNASKLKEDLIKSYKIEKDKIEVMYPAVEVEPFDKQEVKKEFYIQHQIHFKKKIIYFTAKNFKKSGFEQFCDIVNEVEENNFQVVITLKDKDQKDYVNRVLKSNMMDKTTIIIEDEIFNIADIFLLPTRFKNFPLNVVKAMANQCAVLLPASNYGIEVLDIFATINMDNNTNTAYKIDMLLKLDNELKKVQQENYKIGKKLNYDYQRDKLDKIIETLV